jgi:DNA repair protein RecN (Recombination protein N)
MVSKRRDAAGTTSTVTPVLGDLRVAEVARMLGGERPTGTSLAHASEMLSLANTPQKG